MKLKVIELEDSIHCRVVTETGVDIGLFYLDVDGSYYFEPREGGGMFTSYNLKGIAALLEEVNAPFDKQVKEFFEGEKRSAKIGRKVKVKREGYLYSTYWDLFKELGFKNPGDVKELRCKVICHKR